MKRTTFLTVTGLAFAGALAFNSATLLAQDAAPGASPAATASPATELPKSAVPAEDQWQFRTDPLMWFAAIHGDATVFGRQANVNVSFDQIWNHLDGPPLMLYLEARQNKYGFFAQPMYMKLRADANAGPLTGGTTINLWIVEAAGFYQFVKWGEERPLTIDGYAGVRYWNLYNNLNLHTAGGIPVFSRSHTIILTDPIVGLRTSKYLTDKLSLNLSGNVGGFQASSSTSTFSWETTGTVGYDFTKRFSVYTGYNALAIEKHEGNGVDRQGANLVLSGVLLVLDFRW